MTTEEFVIEARRLRAEADDAESRFLSFLVRGEADRAVWAGSGKSYPEFLEGNDLCKATRYIRYKRVLEGLGGDAVAGVGANAIIAAGKLSDPAAQRDVIAEARKVEATNGTTISEQTAERIANETRARFIGASSRNHGYVALAAEADRLRGQVAKLKEENIALRAEIRKLRAAAVESRKPARKDRRAAA